jgi:hypothetical protein
MRFAEVIRRRIRKRSDGVDLVGDVNAAVAANVGERGGGTTHASSSQRIVQRSGRTQTPDVSENEQQQGR